MHPYPPCLKMLVPSLVIFTSFSQLLALEPPEPLESDPSCWLQRSEPAGAGQALELLGSNRSASKKKKIDELRDNLKAEEEKLKAMKTELRKLRRSGDCPSGGEYLTFTSIDNSGDFVLSNGAKGQISINTQSSFPGSEDCNSAILVDGSAVPARSVFGVPPVLCNLSNTPGIFVSVDFTDPPTLNVSSANITFLGNTSEFGYDVAKEIGGSPIRGSQTIIEGDNILDLSAVVPPPELGGVNFFTGTDRDDVILFKINGFTLCGTQAVVVGDPHIKTLDGRHYIMMSQGTFSIWRYSGVKADVPKFQSESSTSIDVDWQVYAHYSSQQSYTRGLLLLDKSGGSLHQSLEITSVDCKWRAKGPTGWSPVGKKEMAALEQIPFATGFEFHSKNKTNRVSFVMIKQGMKTEVATLSVSCRQGRYINLVFDMKHASDVRFVDGELRVGKFQELEAEVTKDVEKFKDLYRFTFKFGLDVDEGQRALPKNIALPLWKLVFSKNVPAVLDRWFAYLENRQLRGISRDTWYMFLNFTEAIEPDFENYDDSEAWPSLFDDFVESEREKAKQQVNGDEELREEKQENGIIKEQSSYSF